MAKIKQFLQNLFKHTEPELEINMDTSGFYSKEHMLRAGKFVYGPGFTLHRDSKDDYTYPVQGWYWYDSAELAAQSFQVRVEDLNLDLPQENL
jgi:hypothetical protein